MSFTKVSKENKESARIDSRCDTLVLPVLGKRTEAACVDTIRVYQG